MEGGWLPLGGVASAAVAFGLLWQRARDETARLRTRVASAEAELERLQLAFGRFAPEQVVEGVIARGIEARGERKEVTALFADLVGYTALSERVDPALLVRILNGYFERMSRAITRHRGHVSTFIGDGILALFGALEANPWQADDAARAALAMRSELADYNRELSADALPELAIGVGLHRGSGVAGLVGSRELMQYAFVGRTINVASRVQGLTRDHRVDVLLTREVADTLDPRFRLRPLASVQARGVARPLEIFALDGGGEESGGSVASGSPGKPR